MQLERHAPGDSNILSVLVSNLAYCHWLAVYHTLWESRSSCEKSMLLASQSWFSWKMSPRNKGTPIYICPWKRYYKYSHFARENWGSKLCILGSPHVQVTRFGDLTAWEFLLLHPFTEPAHTHSRMSGEETWSCDASHGGFRCLDYV